MKYNDDISENGFCAILKRERLKRDLSLRAAGAKIGISHSYLSSLENGEDPRTKLPIVPSKDVLTKICVAYDLDPRDAAVVLNFGSEEDFYLYMARRIHSLKDSDPSKYRSMLNIVLGNPK